MKRKKCGSHLRGSSEAQAPSARAARPLRGDDEIKTKIDLSNISRPGDVLRAITQQKEGQASAPRGSASGSGGKARGGCASSGPANAASGCAFDSSGNVYSRSAARAAACSGRFRGGEAGCERDSYLRSNRSSNRSSKRACDFGFGGSSCCPASSHAASRGRCCTSGFGCARDSCIGRASRCRRTTASRSSAGSCGSAGAAHDCSADRTASGVQSTAAAPGCARCFRCTDRLTRGDHASRAGSSCARTANFPAPASDGARRRSAASVTSWRTPPHASHAYGSGRCASSRSGPRGSASGTSSSRCASGSSGAPARPALCSARRKRRPDEGLHAAAAHGGVERADADHAQYHDHGRHQRKRSGGEAWYSREGCDFAPARRAASSRL